MRRRDFITLVGGAAAAWPMAARGQQPAISTIGWLSESTAASDAPLLRSYREGLNAQGFVEGLNAAVEFRWAEGQIDRTPALVAELIQRSVLVIVVPGSVNAVAAARAATATIPIVFQTAADPVAFGLVASLNRPGGNATGATSLNTELGSKRFELLHQLVPAATTFALLVNPTSPTAAIYSRDAEAAARGLGLGLQVLRASTESEIDAAFTNLVQLHAGALVITADGLFNSRRETLASLALNRAVPTIYQGRPFVVAGGLLSYGADIADQYRLVGEYTGRILKGAKPADLPVQQAAKFELIINLKTAKALGLTVPAILQATADEIIE
jgi:putative ABC transport system substrate-binding protein